MPSISSSPGVKTSKSTNKKLSLKVRYIVARNKVNGVTGHNNKSETVL